MSDEAFVHNGPRIGIVVLGMHRAGTSLLGKILGRLGCDPPRTLIGPSANNAGGYWESHAVVAFNDRLLALAGTSWDDWQDVPAQVAGMPALQDEAAAVLAQEFGASAFFVLKDPRICRLAPFWLACLHAAGIGPRVILALRNPVEVAASLARRNAIEPQLAHLMWLRHMLAAEAATRGMARAVTDYDALHADWQAVMDRTGRQLGLDWPVAPARVGDSATIVDPGLRHHHGPAGALEDDPALPAGLARCHAILRRWTSEAETDTEHAELDELRTRLDREAAAFGPLVALGRRRAVALQTAERRMAGLDTARAAAEAARDNLQRDRDRLEAELAGLQRAAKMAGGKAGPAQAAGQEGQTMPDDVTADLRRMLDMAMADLRAQTEARAALVADHGREMLARSAELARLSALLRQRETELAETQASLQQIQAELATTHRALREAVTDMATTRATMEQTQAETRSALRLTEGDLADTRQRLQARHREAAQAADTVRILLALRSAAAQKAPVAGFVMGLRPRRYAAWQIATLRETGLFDPAFYLAANPDVAAAGADPWRHYLHHGLAENRPPNAGPHGDMVEKLDPVPAESALDRLE